MSGTLVPMGTGVPAGPHQNLKILGTAGSRVPRKFQKLCTAGYRGNFKRWNFHRCENRYYKLLRKSTEIFIYVLQFYSRNEKCLKKNLESSLF